MNLVKLLKNAQKEGLFKIYVEIYVYRIEGA